MNKVKRSGDHYLHPVSKMIDGKDIKHNGRFVFGTGEQSNHNHVITVAKPKDMIVRRDANGDFYFELTANGWLTHVEGTSTKTAEHKKIEIKKGIYRQVHEREVDIFSQTVRRVVD